MLRFGRETIGTWIINKKCEWKGTGIGSRTGLQWWYSETIWFDQPTEREVAGVGKPEWKLELRGWKWREVEDHGGRDKEDDADDQQTKWGNAG